MHRMRKADKEGGDSFLWAEEERKGCMQGFPGEVMPDWSLES